MTPSELREGLLARPSKSKSKKMSGYTMEGNPLSDSEDEDESFDNNKNIKKGDMFNPPIQTSVENAKNYLEKEGISQDGEEMTALDVMFMNDRIIKDQVKQWKKLNRQKIKTLVSLPAELGHFMAMKIMNYIGIFSIERILDNTSPSIIIETLLLLRDELSQFSFNFDERGNPVSDSDKITIRTKQIIKERFPQSGRSWFSSPNEEEHQQNIISVKLKSYEYLLKYCERNNIHYMAMFDRIGTFITQKAQTLIGSIDEKKKELKDNTASIFGRKKRLRKKPDELQMNSGGDISDASDEDEEEKKLGTSGYDGGDTSDDTSDYTSDDTSDNTSDDTSDNTSDDTSDEEKTPGNPTITNVSFTKVTENNMEITKLMEEEKKIPRGSIYYGNLKVKWEKEPLVKEFFLSNIHEFTFYYSEINYVFKVFKDLFPEWTNENIRQLPREIAKKYQDLGDCREVFLKNLILLLAVEKKYVVTPKMKSVYPIHPELDKEIERSKSLAMKQDSRVRDRWFDENLTDKLMKLQEVSDLYFLTGRITIPLCDISLMEEIIQKNQKMNYGYAYPIM